MASPLEPFSTAFMQTALVEIAILSISGGLLGAQIVLRRLAFFTHGVGSATFPGLVLAGPLGVPPPLAALAAGGIFAGGLAGLSRSARLAYDAATALLLVTFLGIGIVLASDVFEAGAGVDRLLFGTLIGLDATDIALSAGALALVLAASWAFGRSWTAAGFEEGGGRALGLPTVAADWALLLVIAAAVVTALDAVGALLVSAIFVLPAAAARLLSRSLAALRAWAVALALCEGVSGLWLAYVFDVPPGPAIALVGGGVFALIALARAVSDARPRFKSPAAGTGAT